MWENCCWWNGFGWEEWPSVALKVAAVVAGMAAVRGTPPMSGVVSVSGWLSLPFDFGFGFSRSESAGLDFGDMTEGLLRGAGAGLFWCFVFLFDCVRLEPCIVSFVVAASPAALSSLSAMAASPSPCCVPPARPVPVSVVLL